MLSADECKTMAEIVLFFLVMIGGAAITWPLVADSPIWALLGMTDDE